MTNEPLSKPSALVAIGLPQQAPLTGELQQQSAKQNPWLFQPGISGNPAGRPKGSRNKLGEDFFADLYESWKAEGPVALRRCAQEKPDVYVRIVASLMRKDFELKTTDPFDEFTDAQLETIIAALHVMIAEDEAAKQQDNGSE